MVLGGVLPPPVFDVQCTDRAFEPPTAKIQAGQAIRYKAASGNSLNHMIAIGDHMSPLLRPGMSWMFNAPLDVGSHKVVCEVTCMKATIMVLPPEAPPKKAAEGPAAPAEEEEEEESDENEPKQEYHDPRIDAMVAQLKATSKSSPWAKEEDEEDEDAAEFHRQRQQRQLGGVSLS